MVTPEMERGSIKCHHYWPDLNEIVRTGHLVISCQFEQNFGHYVHREFLLTDVQVTSRIQSKQYCLTNNATIQHFEMFLTLTELGVFFLFIRVENIVAFHMFNISIGLITVLQYQLHSFWITSAIHRAYIRVSILWWYTARQALAEPVPSSYSMLLSTLFDQEEE